MVLNTHPGDYEAYHTPPGLSVIAHTIAADARPAMVIKIESCSS
jgi:hypothetical protein